jgi:hypothetical protein
MEEVTSSKIDLRHSDSGVVFYICDCSLNPKCSFYKLDREDATKMMKRLKHIEKMTWRQFANLPRENGLTPEIPGTDSYEMIKAQDSSTQQLVGVRYYFHFRVEEKGLFRVFGYQKDQFFCITHIDPEGKIHHN